MVAAVEISNFNEPFTNVRGADADSSSAATAPGHEGATWANGLLKLIFYACIVLQVRHPALNLSLKCRSWKGY